jgi:ABC-type sugar transport system permease subunit
MPKAAPTLTPVFNDIDNYTEALHDSAYRGTFQFYHFGYSAALSVVQFALVATVRG